MKPISHSSRAMALLLTLALLLGLCPTIAWAASEGNTVTFVNYDLSALEGDGYTHTNVPTGARLYTAEELKQENVAFQAESGCTWYLYYPGGGDVASYGPEAIPDPVREGYTFRDWVSQSATGDDVHTVTGDTTFVARYISDAQYILNLYYQFDNETNSVAAETSTTPYGWEDSISVTLPTGGALDGLTPTIKGSDALNVMIAQSDSGYTLTGTMDDTFLENCRTAGFVAWDEEKKDYARDENGNVQINIPVTYTVAGEIEFTVEYWLQDANNPSQYNKQGEDTVEHTVTGTTYVSLIELGLVKEYEGYALTAASAEDAASYAVSANGTTVIQLKYDCEEYYIYYQMNGGNAQEPVQLRYGQKIETSLTDASLAVRAGYEFRSWTWKNQDDTQLTETPTVMPAHDLVLEANWEGTDTKVTLVYWLENANDDDYTVAGQQTITVTSGQTVGYRANSSDQVDVPINNYLSAEAMKDANIEDGEYFAFSQADSSTQHDTGVEGSLKVAEGDGSTVINIGYTRNEYTLVFHLGRVNSSGQTQISTRNFSDSASDWQSGFIWETVATSPSMSTNEKNYTVSNDDSNCYQITAKYGAFISDQWPTNGNDANDAEITTVTLNGATYRLFTWGTNCASPYYMARRNSTTPNGNPNIIGVYPTMSKELIIDADNPSVKHHLVAYWSELENHKTHHYLFEVVPGVNTGNAKIYSFADFATGYTRVATQGAQEDLTGKTFYEINAPDVYTNQDSDNQNAPEFSNLTYQYGYYPNGTNAVGSGDVYFFYTYKDYTLTYHENNPDLTQEGGQETTKTVTFHYIEGKPVAEQLGGIDQANYIPKPFVSSYGNEYTFLGWYTANLTTDATDNNRFKVDWDTFAPSSSINLYAAWEPPNFTLTLIVPEGKLYEDSLTQFAEKGYQVKTTTEGDTITYVISGIPGGTSANHIIENRHGAENTYGLSFDYWSYVVNGQEQKYLFDESQLVTGDMTLTARWKTEYNGQYTVRYLTTENPGNNLGTVELEQTIYYKLREDTTVTGAVVGASVTEEAQPISGYLSSQGFITQVVEAPEGTEVQTYFDFIYTKITTDTQYTVHYVLDTGTDYGREEPPEGVVELAESKTVLVDETTLNQSTSISEAALVLGGYTPRDGWNHTFTLSAKPEENHLYIYYVSNTHKVKFAVTYYFPQSDGSYTQDEAYTFRLDTEDVLGKVIYASELVDNYGKYLEDTGILDSKMKGHVLNETLTHPSYILLRDQTSTQEGQVENVLHIYLKYGDYTLTYHLNDGDDPTYSATWSDVDDFLTPGDRQYSQTVTYPDGADVPTTTPTRRAYVFAGWNTAQDGSGTLYTSLTDAPWYKSEGMYEDVDLYAQWTQALTVTFHLRGGDWTDSGENYYQEADGTYVTYVGSGQTLSPPSAPTLVTQEGAAHSFVGWTDTDPETWNFVGTDKRVDLVEFEKYRFNFETPITGEITLYAVWDPDVTTFNIVKTDTGNKPLADAVFTLERLQANVTSDGKGGYTYTLVKDSTGAYQIDTSFATRTLTTNAEGAGAFEHLPSGYYRLTETQPPDGYQGLTDSVILFAPYEGEPSIYEPNSTYVTGTPVEGNLTVTVENIPQYSVEITAPTSLTLTYTPPDYIWNPETLAYEPVAGSKATWDVSGDPSTITVKNTSQGNTPLLVSVTLAYLNGYTDLGDLSTLTGPTGFTGTQQLTGTLAQGATAEFNLTLEGATNLPLPGTPTQAGSITVVVSLPQD